MNIQELQSERDALQNRLRSMIQKELEQFQFKTAVGVNSINVYLICMQKIGTVESNYIVGEVQVDLDI